MGCTVEELKQRMKSAEFTDWLAYDQTNPISPLWSDMKDAMLMALVHNCFTTGKPKQPGDFLANVKQALETEHSEQEQKEEMRKIKHHFRLMALRSGGKIIDPKKGETNGRHR